MERISRMTRFATILVALLASAQVPAATSPTPSNAASAANQTVRLMNEGDMGMLVAYPGWFKVVTP